MNKFFVLKEVYNERMSICKTCDKYFKLTGSCKVCGCFMRIKANISICKCPLDKWLATDKVGEPEIPIHLKQEILYVWEKIKTGTATDLETKKRFVELYNTIYNTKYKHTTNCGSCLQSMWNGIKSIYEKL